MNISGVEVDALRHHFSHPAQGMKKTILIDQGLVNDATLQILRCWD